MYIQGNLIERDGRIFYGDIDVSYVRDCVYFIYPAGPHHIMIHFIEDGLIKSSDITLGDDIHIIIKTGIVPNADQVEHLLALQWFISAFIVFYKDSFAYYSDLTSEWVTIPIHVPVEHRIFDRFSFRLEGCVVYYTDADYVHIKPSGEYSRHPYDGISIDMRYFETKLMITSNKYELTDNPITVYDGIYYDNNGNIYTVQLEREKPYIRMLKEGERIYRRRQAARFGKTKSARNVK